MTFKQQHEYRRSNVIRQIRAYSHSESAKVFPYYFVQVALHYIGIYYVYVVEFRKSFLQDRQQTLVDLNCRDLIRTKRKLLCKNTDTCTDLQHSETALCVALLRYSRANTRVDDKILPQSL